MPVIDVNTPLSCKPCFNFFASSASGVFVTGIAFPTVPEGKARLRTIMSAAHTQDQLNRALEVLKKVGKRRGILA